MRIPILCCLALIVIQSPILAARELREPIIYAEADAEPPGEIKIETRLDKADYCRLGRLLFRMSLLEPELRRGAPVPAKIHGTYDVQWNTTAYPWHGGHKDYSVAFFFQQGHVLPLSGALYRVEKLVQFPENSGEGHALLKRLDDEWTKAIAPQRDSIIAVLKRGQLSVYDWGSGGLTVHNLEVRVESIDVPPREAGAQAVATVHLGRFEPQKVADNGFLIFPLDKTERAVKHKVRRVVPTDKEKGVAGWIELDPEPIPTEEKLALAPPPPTPPPRKPVERVYAEADAEPLREVKLETPRGNVDFCRLGRLIFNMRLNYSDFDVWSPTGAWINGTYDVPWNSWTEFRNRGNNEYGVVVHFEQGQALPLSGAVYRVEKVAQEGRDNRQGFALLKRLDDEWAKAISPHGDSMISMVQRRGWLAVHKQVVFVEAIDVEPHNGGTRAVATVRVGVGEAQKVQKVTDNGFLIFPPDKMQRTVKHKVRRVVPADKEKGIFGWVELDPEPIADDPKP